MIRNLLLASCVVLGSCQATRSVETPAPQATRYEVVRLEHASAGEMASVLNQLLAAAPGPGASSFSAAMDARTNSLLLRGSENDVAQARGLVVALDIEVVSQAGHSGAGSAMSFQSVALKHAVAQEVAQVLNQLLAGGRGGSHTTAIMADGRTNSLLIRVHPDELQRVLDLVARIDVELDQG